jgi:hypothetical protein
MASGNFGSIMARLDIVVVLDSRPTPPLRGLFGSRGSLELAETKRSRVRLFLWFVTS